jgi:hypothetical protein
MNKVVIRLLDLICWIVACGAISYGLSLVAPNVENWRYAVASMLIVTACEYYPRITKFLTKYA